MTSSSVKVEVIDIASSSSDEDDDKQVSQSTDHGQRKTAIDTVFVDEGDEDIITVSSTRTRPKIEIDNRAQEYKFKQESTTAGQSSLFLSGLEPADINERIKWLENETAALRRKQAQQNGGQSQQERPEDEGTSDEEEGNRRSRQEFEDIFGRNSWSRGPTSGPSRHEQWGSSSRPNLPNYRGWGSPDVSSSSYARNSRAIVPASSRPKRAPRRRKTYKRKSYKRARKSSSTASRSSAASRSLYSSSSTSRAAGSSRPTSAVKVKRESGASRASSFTVKKERSW